jgi:glucarate dehydratase
MKITDIRATTVTVPLEAPLRHSNGAHWGRFVRTVVEIETDEGIIGLGEMGGGGESAALAFAGLKTYLIGHDPFDLNRMQYAICNPTASLYNNRTQLHAALEFACLDIIGKKLGVPVFQLFGGRVRDEIKFASYLFYRYPNPESGSGEVRTIEQLIDHAKALKAKRGFTTHKLKAGVFHPDCCSFAISIERRFPPSVQCHQTLRSFPGGQCILAMHIQTVSAPVNLGCAQLHQFQQ